MKCVINCSSDRIQLWYAGIYEELSHKGLEYARPEKVLMMMNNYKIEQIYLVNGPGSFTTLRVVCLTINGYISATGSSVIELYSITKTQLFESLLDGSGITSMMMYIGQRLNMRHYYFDRKQYKVVAKGSVIDLYDDVSSEYIDNVPMCALGVEDDMMVLNIGGHTYKRLLNDLMSRVSRFDPHYMIQPNVSVSHR